LYNLEISGYTRGCGELPAQHWRNAFAAFERALAMPAEERVLFVETSVEPSLREIVLELLDQEALDEAGTGGEFPSRTGTRLGRYEVLELLGRGGNAQVYAARDTQLDRPVALKFLLPGAVESAASLERLLREAKAAGSLNHPHIVTVYEVIREGDQVAIAMERIDGRPLQVEGGSPQPRERVAELGRQIAQALATAHAHGIVHRDIKPANVMVRADGYVKVVDFGLARSSSPWNLSVSLTGALAGTVDYMSPEQAECRRVTTASDVFSLGIVLYELAAGAHPFRTGSPIDTAYAIAHRTPAAPAKLNSRIGAALNGLIVEMLARNPESRPTAQAVEQRLAEIARAPLPQRTSGARTFFLVSALVAAFALGMVLWMQRAPSRVEPRPEYAQVTRLGGGMRVTAAALSHDGAWLAFAAFGSPLSLRRMSDGETRHLNAPADLNIDRIAWFADGHRLLVSAASQTDTRAGLWVVPIDGTAAQRAVPAGKDGVPSPDGSRIAFVSPDGAFIWTAGVHGESPQQIRAGGSLTAFSSLVWSPDGKRLVYQRQDSTPGRAGDETSESLQLERNFRHSVESVSIGARSVVASIPDVTMASAVALPDGRVIFLRWESLGLPIVRTIWSIRTDPHSGAILGPPRRLSSGEGRYASSISASDDGNKIAVVLASDILNIFLADLAPGTPRFRNVRRLTYTDADDYPHAWTPDGMSVIFESSRNGQYNLFRQAIDAHEPEPLVVGTENSVLAKVSPDRKWILYTAQYKPGPICRVKRVPVNGGMPELVPVPEVRGGFHEFQCALQRGSRCVIRSVEDNQFVFRELDPLGGVGRELARTSFSPTVVGDWSLSPDGSTIAIPNHDPHEARIRLVNLDATSAFDAETTIQAAGLRDLNGLTYTADGKGWYVSVATSTGGALLYVDLRGHAHRLLESARPTYVVPSPDGKYVAFPDRTVSSNVELFQPN
jgi:Tol biopolymer transport system component